MSSIPQIPQGAFPQAQAMAPAPPYSLFDANSVALATFFGWPIAGAMLMLVNDARLGRTGRGMLMLLAAIVVTSLAILAVWNIPHGGGSIFVILLLMAMAFIARKAQGAAVEEHVRRGGKLGSKWAAFGLGMVFLVVICGIVYAIVSIQDGPKVVIGTKDEVYYTGSATQADATALGNQLKSVGYFSDAGVTVLLGKGKNGTVVSFVVKEGIWDKPDMVAGFDEVARGAAPLIGGFPIEVRLLNKDRDVKNTTTVGKVLFGTDHIYYLGTATQGQAEALGQELKTDGFFIGKGFGVFLSKQSDGTTLSFVVANGASDDPAMVASFEKIARDAAPAIGGLPIRLHLVDPQLEVKKDEPLN
jgi:hypothetical protein